MNSKLMFGLPIITLLIGIWIGTSIGASKQITQAPATLQSGSSTSDPTDTIETVTVPTYDNTDENAVDTVSTDQAVTAADDAYQQLQQRITELEEYASEQGNKVLRLQQYNDSANRRLRDAGLAVPESMTIEEARELLPAPFDQVIVNAGDSMIKAFKEHQAEEQDYDWALQMETRISDFFAVHELSNQVRLDSVICKTNMCEIRGFQASDIIANQIMKELNAQDWFVSIMTRSLGGDNYRAEQVEGFGNEVDAYPSYFYVLVTMLR